MTHSGFQGESAWRHEAGCAIWASDGASCTCAVGRLQAEVHVDDVAAMLKENGLDTRTKVQ